MKNTITLIFALAMLCSAAGAQSSQSTIHGPGDPRTLNPIPSCTFTKIYVDDTTGTVYTAPGYPCAWQAAFTGHETFSLVTASTGSVPASTSKYAAHQAAYSGTIQTVVGSSASFTCTVNPVLTFYDCGTDLACASPTAKASVTLTSSASMVAGTITSASITAGNTYIWKFDSGTCTTIQASVTAQD